MAYTAPRTWVTGELVTATLLNTHIRDNMDALKAPPTSVYNVNEASDYQTTGTSFADVDATDLALTITTTGGDVEVWFSGAVDISSSTSKVYLDVAQDGTRVGGDDGIVMFEGNTLYNGTLVMSFKILVQSVSAASHTYKLQWKISTGTATMWAGAGTSTYDMHPQFGVRETS